MTNELLDAMRVASESGDPADRLAVCRAFSGSEVFVPLLADGELLTVRGRDGRSVGVAFTDLDAFANWRPEGTWGSLFGDELARILLDGGAQALLVNVHGPFGGELDRQELSIVASGSALAATAVAPGIVQFTVTEESALRLRSETSAPDDLRQAVVEAGAATAQVGAIYLLRVDAPGPSHLALGVSIEEGAAWPSVAKRLGSAIHPRLKSEQELDLIPLEPAQLEFLADASPLFERI